MLHQGIPARRPCTATPPPLHPLLLSQMTEGTKKDGGEGDASPHPRYNSNNKDNNVAAADLVEPHRHAQGNSDVQLEEEGMRGAVLRMSSRIHSTTTTNNNRVPCPPPVQEYQTEEEEHYRPHPHHTTHSSYSSPHRIPSAAGLKYTHVNPLISARTADTQQSAQSARQREEEESEGIAVAVEKPSKQTRDDPVRPIKERSSSSSPGTRRTPRMGTREGKGSEEWWLAPMGIDAEVDRLLAAARASRGGGSAPSHPLSPHTTECAASALPEKKAHAIQNWMREQIKIDKALVAALEDTELSEWLGEGSNWLDSSSHRTEVWEGTHTGMEVEAGLPAQEKQKAHASAQAFNHHHDKNTHNGSSNMNGDRHNTRMSREASEPAEEAGARQYRAKKSSVERRATMERQEEPSHHPCPPSPPATSQGKCAQQVDAEIRAQQPLRQRGSSSSSSSLPPPLAAVPPLHAGKTAIPITTTTPPLEKRRSQHSSSLLSSLLDVSPFPVASRPPYIESERATTTSNRMRKEVETGGPTPKHHEEFTIMDMSPLKKNDCAQSASKASEGRRRTRSPSYPPSASSHHSHHQHHQARGNEEEDERHGGVVLTPRGGCASTSASLPHQQQKQHFIPPSSVPAMVQQYMMTREYSSTLPVYQNGTRNQSEEAGAAGKGSPGDRSRGGQDRRTSGYAERRTTLGDPRGGGGGRGADSSSSSSSSSRETTSNNDGWEKIQKKRKKKNQKKHQRKVYDGKRTVLEEEEEEEKVALRSTSVRVPLHPPRVPTPGPLNPWQAPLNVAAVRWVQEKKEQTPSNTALHKKRLGSRGRSGSSPSSFSPSSSFSASASPASSSSSSFSAPSRPHREDGVQRLRNKRGLPPPSAPADDEEEAGSTRHRLHIPTKTSVTLNGGRGGRVDNDFSSDGSLQCSPYKRKEGDGMSSSSNAAGQQRQQRPRSPSPLPRPPYLQSADEDYRTSGSTLGRPPEEVTGTRKFHSPSPSLSPSFSPPRLAPHELTGTRVDKEREGSSRYRNAAKFAKGLEGTGGGHHPYDVPRVEDASSQQERTRPLPSGRRLRPVVTLESGETLTRFAAAAMATDCVRPWGVNGSPPPAPGPATTTTPPRATAGLRPPSAKFSYAREVASRSVPPTALPPSPFTLTSALTPPPAPLLPIPSSSSGIPSARRHTTNYGVPLYNTQPEAAPTATPSPSSNSSNTHTARGNKEYWRKLVAEKTRRPLELVRVTEGDTTHIVVREPEKTAEWLPIKALINDPEAPKPRGDEDSKSKKKKKAKKEEEASESPGAAKQNKKKKKSNEEEEHVAGHEQPQQEKVPPQAEDATITMQEETKKNTERRATNDTFLDDDEPLLYDVKHFKRMSPSFPHQPNHAIRSGIDPVGEPQRIDAGGNEEEEAPPTFEPNSRLTDFAAPPSPADTTALPPPTSSSLAGRVTSAYITTEDAGRLNHHHQQPPPPPQKNVEEEEEEDMHSPIPSPPPPAVLRSPEPGVHSGGGEMRKSPEDDERPHHHERQRSSSSSPPSAAAATVPAGVTSIMSLINTINPMSLTSTLKTAGTPDGSAPSPSPSSGAARDLLLGQERVAAIDHWLRSASSSPHRGLEERTGAFPEYESPPPPSHRAVPNNNDDDVDHPHHTTQSASAEEERPDREGVITVPPRPVQAKTAGSSGSQPGGVSPTPSPPREEVVHVKEV